MKREINLSPEQVKAILMQAKEASLRDHLLLKTMTVGDFRVGEVVGSAARRWVPFCDSCQTTGTFESVGESSNHNGFKVRAIQCIKCGKTWNTPEKPPGKWIPAEPNLRGLQIQDLHDDGVWVEGKGWRKAKNPALPKLVPLPLELVKDLRAYVGTRKQGRIFEISESRVEQMTRIYAKRAGVIDWKLVHPHRFRHFTTTQIARKFGVLAARDIARHANISTTNRYISELPEEEKRKIIQEQTDLISV